MQPVRMQLDGPDLEALLIRARQQYGSGIRIVKADKVRSGGVGGFFTKEHYELTVETDDDLDGAGSFSGAGRSPDQDVAFVADTRTFTPAPPAKPAAPTSSIIDIERPSLDSLAATAAHRPVSLIELADAISDQETAAHPRTLLSPPPASSMLSGSSGTSAPSANGGPAVSTEGSSFASILAGLTESVAEPVSAPQAARASAAYEQDGSPETPESFVPSRPPIAEPGVRKIDLRPARRPLTRDASALALQDLGMPARLLPLDHDGDLLGALVQALRALPPLPQPPRRPGAIFTVAGEGESAWDAALELARSMDLDERALVYVTQGQAPTKVAPAKRVTSLDQLLVRIDRWRKRSSPTIVVVDAPMTPRAAQANREILETLEADAVWLVVSATRKTDDVAQWAERLGHTDGLVVTDVDASRDPASVLRLGIPVAWLDGRPATAGAWAGLLVERLVEVA